jgi:hypothetical protein
MGDFENYVIDGVKLDRVTSVLGIINKPALVYWYGQNGTRKCREILKSSAAFGTDLHAYIEYYLKTGLDPEIPIETPKDEDKKKLFYKYKDWATQNGVVCVEAELRVHSLRWGYAGTLDSLVRCNGKLEIHDYKTSKSFYETYQLQLMAYLVAMKEMGLYVNEPVGRRVIRLGRDDGEIETVAFEDAAGDYKAWLSALRLYRWNKKASEALKNRAAKAA